MSNNNDLVSSINYATVQVNRHGAAIMILFGTIGNVLNICILNDQSLSKIPCAIYLCWSSVSSVLCLWTALLTRVLQGYNVNWPNQNEPVCKIRLYLLSVSWATAIWYLVGASMDRYLCSHHSAVYRRWSTERIARRFVIGIFFFFVLICSQALYCFEASVPNVPVSCYGRTLPCRIYNDWFVIIIDIIIPSTFLFIFGTLTIRNAQKRIVYPAINQPNSNNISSNRVTTRNNDRNLTRMLFIQVSVVLILDLPFGFYRSYTSLTANISKSSYRVAIENLVYALIILVFFFTYSTSFYLYTLTGTLYRQAFKNMGYRWLQKFQRTH